MQQLDGTLPKRKRKLEPDEKELASTASPASTSTSTSTPTYGSGSNRKTSSIPPRTCLAFALDQVRDPILILQLLGPRNQKQECETEGRGEDIKCDLNVEFINRSMFNLFGVPSTFSALSPCPIPSFFQEFSFFADQTSRERFLRCVRKLVPTSVEGTNHNPHPLPSIQKHLDINLRHSTKSASLPSHVVLSLLELESNRFNIDETLPNSDHSVQFYICCSFYLRDGSQVVQLGDESSAHNVDCDKEEQLWVSKNKFRQHKKSTKILDQLQEFSGIMACAVELDEQRRDLLRVYVTKKLLEFSDKWQDPYSHIWCVEDIGMDRQDIDAYIAKFGTMLREGRTESVIEKWITFPDGRRRYLHTSCHFAGRSPSSGRPRFFTVVQDLTDLRVVEEQLQARTEDLARSHDQVSIFMNFFENAPIMMGVVDVIDDYSDCKHTFVNPSVTDWLHVDPVGRKWSEVSPQSLEKRRSIFKYYRASKETGKAIKFELLDEDRQPPVFISCIVKHVKDDLYVYLGQDVTEYKLLAQELKENQEELEKKVQERTKQLEEAIQVKTRFLANMSHEIRTPLSGVVGVCSILESERNLTSEQYQLIQTAQTCGKQLLTVINDILDLSKLEEKKMVLECAEFSLDSVIEEALDILSFECDKKRLELISDISLPKGIMYVGDAARIRQILVNLLSNAVKFSFEANEVVVCASSQTAERRYSSVPYSSSDAKIEKVLIKVQDHGIGISEAARDQLFKPFHQADNSTTRRYGGSGLGLCISKQLCELMAGKIWFESSTDETNHGTSFYLTIELPRASFPSSDNDPRKPTGTYHHYQQNCSIQHLIELEKYRDNFSSKKILLVDRSLTLLGILQKQIEQFGFLVHTFTTIANVLETIHPESSNNDNSNDKYYNTQNNENKNPAQPFYDLVMMDDTQNLEQVNQALARNLFVLPLVITGYNPLKDRNRSPLLERCIPLKKPIKIRPLHQLLFNYFVRRIPSNTFQHYPHSNKDQGNNPENSYNDRNTGCYSPTFDPNKKTSENIAILIAEDNAMNVMVLTKMLSRLGYVNYHVAENGREAIEALKLQKFDIILMDIMMPIMGGLEATQIIRKGEALFHMDQGDQQPYIIALTANAFEEDRHHYLKAGMDEVLTKPLESKTLQKALEKATECLKQQRNS